MLAHALKAEPTLTAEKLPVSIRCVRLPRVAVGGPKALILGNTSVVSYFRLTIFVTLLRLCSLLTHYCGILDSMVY